MLKSRKTQGVVGFLKATSDAGRVHWVTGWTGHQRSACVVS